MRTCLDRNILLSCKGFTFHISQTLPFLKVRVVLRVVLVTGLLQGVVEVIGVFLIDIHRRQVCASAEPPLLGAWRKEGTRVLIHPHPQ